MRSATLFASVLAFAASAIAQDATPGYAVVSAPGKGETVPSGKTYTIQWSAGKFSGPATISLMGGNDPTTLVILDPIATTVNVEDESFSWKVDCSLGEDKTYGLKIADNASGGATFQYSFPFEIKGPSCGSDSDYPVSSSSSVSASATSSAISSATSSASITASTTISSYPTKGTNSTTSATVSSSSTVKTSTSVSASVSTSVKPTTSASSTATTLATLTTPVVTVTEGVSVTASSSGIAATSTTTSSPVPTAGAARAGAGIALGLFAAVLAL
ncbi:hypothetical protein GQX73_g6136 [Xylaria multiplex]|uniref:Yeast cell wall synthesis Kre9/Knh1-like N-terminal domain-containing protein n=1 Tax=Xylaria multiplex TaxID=323545 RepID=A0A7C8IRR4_9PEZI|nr:hypothetical protein GQX73_g6136 [Xylaria multiplex]